MNRLGLSALAVLVISTTAAYAADNARDMTCQGKLTEVKNTCFCRRLSRSSGANVPELMSGCTTSSTSGASGHGHRGNRRHRSDSEPAPHDDLAFTEIGSDVAHRRAELITRWPDRNPCDAAICADGLSSGSPTISSVRRITDAAFVQAEVAIEPRYQVEQIPTAIALVEAGLGVTALPSLTFSMFKGRKLAMRPLVQPRLRRNVGFVTFGGRTMPHFTDALLQAIRHGLLQELQVQSHQA